MSGSQTEICEFSPWKVSHYTVVLVLSRLVLTSIGMNVYVHVRTYAMTISQPRASTYLVLTMATDIHVPTTVYVENFTRRKFSPPALIGKIFIKLNFCPVLKIAGDLYCIWEKFSTNFFRNTKVAGHGHGEIFIQRKFRVYSIRDQYMMMLSSMCWVCAVIREASTLCIYTSTP